MRKYLREHSDPGVIKDTFEIYGCNFLPILVASLPALPFAFLQDYILANTSIELNFTAAAALSLSHFVSLTTISIITIIVSYICLGFGPNLLRSFKRFTLPVLGKMLLTYLGVWLVSTGAIYLYQFIGDSEGINELLQLPLHLVTLASLTVFYALTLFVPCVVILEGKWGLAAYKRSFELSVDFLLRHAGFVFMYLFLFFQAFLIQIYLVEITSLEAISVFKNLFGLLIGPLGSVCVVLLYYDARVRKEAFDYDVMEEELGTEDE